jgi:hypothetical protein
LHHLDTIKETKERPFMPDPKKPIPPFGLANGGLNFWHEIADDFELRSDELRLLEAACRTLDELTLIQRELSGANLVCTGSQGQDVANPLLAAAISHRRTFAAMVRQLALPDIDGETGETSNALSEKRRAAANTRWDRQRALAAGFDEY